MLKRIMRTLKDKKGQGMVEYGLILALIAIVVVLALTPAGDAVADIFTSITNSIRGTVPQQ